MAWETFRRRMRPSPKNPMVTLSVSGQMGLNAAVVRNLLGDAKFALLLFDRERSLIGVKFLKTSEPDAYPVKISPNKGHGAITAMAFMKTYDIMPTETRAYSASYDEKNRILMVDIRDTVGKAGTIRKRLA